MTQSPTTREEAERIAAGLSETTTMVILQKGVAYGRAYFMASIMRPLVRRGLFTRADPPKSRPTYALTALGLAVRDALLKESAHDL